MWRLWRELAALERDHRLDFLREPDPGFAWAAYRWAEGDDLDEVLGGTTLAAGDFVRWVKQLIDLCGQVADAAGDTPLRRTAREAVAAAAPRRGRLLVPGGLTAELPARHRLDDPGQRGLEVPPVAQLDQRGRGRPGCAGGWRRTRRGRCRGPRRRPAGRRRGSRAAALILPRGPGPRSDSSSSARRDARRRCRRTSAAAWRPSCRRRPATPGQPVGGVARAGWRSRRTARRRCRTSPARRRWSRARGGRPRARCRARGPRRSSSTSWKRSRSPVTTSTGIGAPVARVPMTSSAS